MALQTGKQGETVHKQGCCTLHTFEYHLTCVLQALGLGGEVLERGVKNFRTGKPHRRCSPTLPCFLTLLASMKHTSGIDAFRMFSL